MKGFMEDKKGRVEGYGVKEWRACKGLKKSSAVWLAAQRLKKNLFLYPNPVI